MIRLETERLILRDIKKSDIKDLIKNANNLNVSKKVLDVPYPYKKKNATWWINKCTKDSKAKPRTEYALVIEFKPKRRMVGSVGLHNVNAFQKTATIGYWLGEDYWRRGIMYEAASKLIEFAFKKLKLRRIDVSVFRENKPSENLIKKLGFKYEGTRPKKYRSKADKKIHDERIYGLLKEHYQKTHD